MRIFAATLATETNTLVGFPTGLANFERCQLVRGGIEGQPEGLWTSPALAWLRRARARGWTFVESLHAFAEPGGVVVRAAFKSMRDEILRDLAAALPVDAVLLALHGAMVAQGVDDCEGDLLGRVRAIVGPAVPIGVELDLHCHLTPAITDNASFVVIYKNYPHVDYAERAHEAFDILEGVLDGRVRPVMATAPCRVMGLFPTTRGEAMPALCRRMAELEREQGVLSVSLAHGCPWADLPFLGARALVVANRDRALAQELAGEVARRFFEGRADAALAYVPMDEALERAAAAPRGPVLLADTSDQVGGGAPGDSTFLLQAVLERRLGPAAFAPFYDPMAVYRAFQVGQGGMGSFRVGGKLDRFSGAPLDLEAEVVGLFPGSWQEGLNGEPVPHGAAAVIRVGGNVDVLLTGERTNLFTPSLFTRHGLEPARYRVLGVKALYRYWDRFRPLCADMVLVATPGACSPAWGSLGLRRVPRPIWPMDAIDGP